MVGTAAYFSCFARGLHYLKKPILISYCLCLFGLNKNCPSLWATALRVNLRQSSAPHKGSTVVKIDQRGIATCSGRALFTARFSQLKDDSSTMADMNSEGSVSGVVNTASPSEASQPIPQGYKDARVLLVGDGDLSFAAALSSLKICKSLLATSWDSKERLIKSFPRAAENIRIIEENGDTVGYGVDATDLPGTLGERVDDAYDTIAWNFPHIPGKQNIKRNRELIQNFMTSAFTLQRSRKEKVDVMVKIALCEGQSGTKAKNMDDWNFSWKLVHQASEADCLLTNIEPFPLNAFPGYLVTGHRGHGGDFPTGTAPEIFTFRKSALLPTMSPTQPVLTTSVVMDVNAPGNPMADSRTGESPSQRVAQYEAVQAPSYIHEVHLLAVSMVSSLIDLEARAREGVRLIIARYEEEDDLEKIRGGEKREDSLNKIRLAKQTVPVRRRYRTQEDRDEQALVKIAIADGIMSGSDSDSDSDSYMSEENEDSSNTLQSTSAVSSSLEGSIDLSDSSSPLTAKSIESTRHNSSVWAVNLVDVYTCPRTLQVSHAFQVTYCSLTRPIGRTVADKYRERIERDLPPYLGMVPRIVKHGGLVSLPYPWYITSAVRSILAGAANAPHSAVIGPDGRISTDSQTEDSLEAGTGVVDVSDLAMILRELELEERALNGNTPAVPSSAVTSADSGEAKEGQEGATAGQVNTREKIRTIARTLWQKRVGVLIQTQKDNGQSS